MCVVGCALALGLFAGCGGGDDGPLDSAALVEQADSICDDANTAFNRGGNRGLTNASIVAEMEYTNQVVGNRQAEFEALEVSEDLQADWGAFVKASGEQEAANAEVIAAARKDDTEGVGAAFAKSDKVGAERTKAAEKLGFKVCGQVPVYETEPTGTGPAADLLYAKPKNTIEEAADAYIKAVGSGDCAAQTTVEHSDNGEVSRDVCAAVTRSFKGAGVIGTEQYGPAGVAEIKSRSGGVFTLQFVQDTDGLLKHGGDLINDGVGMRPANEDNDADATAAAVVDGLRSGSADQFNATLYDGGQSAFFVKENGFKTIGTGPTGSQLVADVRAGGSAMAEPLGINQAYAFYLLDANGRSYVLSLAHYPGDGSKYLFASYFPIPTAK